MRWLRSTDLIDSFADYKCRGKRRHFFLLYSLYILYVIYIFLSVQQGKHLVISCLFYSIDKTDECFLILLVLAVWYHTRLYFSASNCWYHCSLPSALTIHWCIAPFSKVALFLHTNYLLVFCLVDRNTQKGKTWPKNTQS